jgi:hypothetical protein
MSDVFSQSEKFSSVEHTKVTWKLQFVEEGCCQPQCVNEASKGCDLWIASRSALCEGKG